MPRNSQTKRASWHDYRSPGRYMITLCKSPTAEPFSSIKGDWRLPVGIWGSSFTRWSATGKIIADKIYHIANIHPSLRAEQYVVMPDHVHLLLNVAATLPEQLGNYIARFKNAIYTASGTTGLFEEGFNDQIISYQRDLQTIFNYIRANPYRLAVRQAIPDFFKRLNSLTIGSTTCQAYGNLQLLDCPFKSQVIVHRADTTAQHARHRAEWLHTAANGGVLVSPFISKREKEIRAEAEATGGRLILIINEAFGERYKPAAHDFGLCAEGRLLIISLGRPRKASLSRQDCMEMNALAAMLGCGAHAEAKAPAQLQITL